MSGRSQTDLVLFDGEDSINKTRSKVLLDIFCRGTMEQALFLIQNITLGTIIHYRGTGYNTKNTVRDNIKWVDITFHIRFQTQGQQRQW